MLERAHLAGLWAFALLLGLFEGPAEIACAFALLTLLVGRGRQGVTLGPIELGLLVWLLAGGLGGLGSGLRSNSETLTRPLLALAFLLGRGSISRLEDRWTARLAWAFGGALVVNGAYGLFQVFAFDPPLETLIIGRVKHQGLVDPLDGERLRMATGLFYNRIKLAHLGVVGLALLTVLGVYVARARRWALAGGVLLALAVFLTYRRAAPLSLLVALAVYGLAFGGRARERWLLGASGLALVAGSGLLVTATGRYRIVQAKDALLERFEIYAHALSLWRESPWLGVGHGHYRAAIGGVTDRLSPLLQQSAHSWFLETLVETGVVGLLGLLVALTGAVVRLTRRLRVRGESAPSEPAVLRDRFTWIALLSLVLLGLAHSVLFHRPVALAFWTLLGMAAGAPGDIRTSGLSSRDKIARGSNTTP